MLNKFSDIRVKVILLGDGRVGKTSLAVRYTQGKFQANYKPSLGVDFLIKRVTIDNRQLKILVFDTAGQETISSIRKKYYYGAHGAVIVYDVTRRKTFENIPTWLNELKDQVGEIYTVIVGNKTDLMEEREVSYDEALAFAKELGADYLETSALSGENVTDLFQMYIDYVIQELES